MSKPQTFEINWFAATGSALGAVSSAVVLSTLGAAGTLIGAALGSLVITVGGSIYTQSLQKTKAHVDTRRGTVRSSRTDLATSRVNDVSPPDPPSALPPKPPRKPLGDILRDLPWKRILWLAAGLFVAAMAVILVFELSTGRPVSSFTGGTSETRKGTTINGLEPTSETSPDAQDTDLPLGEESPGAVPSVEGKPVEATPTVEQSDEENPTQAQPTAEPTAEAQPQAQEETVEPSVEPPATVEPPADQQPTNE